MSRRSRQATKRQVQQRQQWQKLNPHPHDWADQERRLAQMEQEMRGFVRRREPFYLCEIGLRDVNRGASQRDNHPQTMPDAIRTGRKS